MDEHTDSDFLALKEQVTEGFAMNSEEHARLCNMAKENDRRSETLDAILAEVVLFNKTVSSKLFGNGAVGCMETQRNHASFLKSVKRVLWMAVMPMALGYIALAVRHLLDK